MDSQDLTGQSGDEDRARGAQLLAETVDAHGGDALLNLQNLTLTGPGEFSTPPQLGGMTVPIDSFTLHCARGGRSRLEARSFGGRLIFVIRGRGKGGFGLVAGRHLELPTEHTDGMEPIDLLRSAVTENYPVLAVPAEPTDLTAEGTPLLRYDIQRGPGMVTRCYVEADTKRVRKMVTATPRGEMTILLSGYGSLPLAEVFGEVQLLENGAQIFKLRATNVALDEPLRDSLFEQP